MNASAKGPFHSFTYNDATLPAPYGRHCWADSSFTWQGRGNLKGQVSGRGPGFPIAPPLPSGFTHHHLSGLREVPVRMHARAIRARAHGYVGMSTRTRTSSSHVHNRAIVVVVRVVHRSPTILRSRR